MMSPEGRNDLRQHLVSVIGNATDASIRLEVMWVGRTTEEPATYAEVLANLNAADEALHAARALIPAEAF